MTLVLRQFEDILHSGQIYTGTSAWPRAIYVAAGAIDLQGAPLTQDNGSVVREPLQVTAGEQGACLWRWELITADTVSDSIGERRTLQMESKVFEQDVTDSHLMRLDSVAFPPAGCAYLHTHQGPGIRCLIEGRIRIDTDGHSTAYAPGSPWFEAGPEPVFAQADDELATRFIRTMVLPKALLGQSSIRYVNAEDQAKPKSQRYRVFSEALLSG